VHALERLAAVATTCRAAAQKDLDAGVSSADGQRAAAILHELVPVAVSLQADLSVLEKQIPEWAIAEIGKAADMTALRQRYQEFGEVSVHGAGSHTNSRCHQRRGRMRMAEVVKADTRDSSTLDEPVEAVGELTRV
jgi:hypothetical protein